MGNKKTWNDYVNKAYTKGKKAKSKIHTVMSEFKRGTLHSGKSKKKVKSRKQAIAIALSEARRHS